MRALNLFSTAPSQRLMSTQVKERHRNIESLGICMKNLYVVSLKFL